MTKWVMRFTLTLILVVAPTAPWAKNADAVVAENNKPILVRSGQPVIEIQLRENPSTGYRWMLKGGYNPLLIQPVSATFKPKAAQKPGQAGIVTWKFRLKAAAFVVPRVLHVTLVHGRPWDMRHAKKRRFVIVTN